LFNIKLILCFVDLDAKCQLLTFDPYTAYAAGTKPWSTAAGDFNSDNYTDIIVANRDSNTIGVYFNYGNGTFREQLIISNGSLPQFVITFDLNNDTKTDILIAQSDSDSVGVLLGYGNGTFSAEVDFAVGSYPYWIAVGDFNGDNRPDLVVVNDYKCGRITWLW
jgi:hypothetical protein